ncbi:hypothetical protein AGMMS50268_33690 [Spirochaetia bacterium]|nr:hypothetical protein AGMMS50268_33690 [Spirochaetia bacterium]
MVIPFQDVEQARILADEELFALSDELMKQNKKVYKELVK